MIVPFAYISFKPSHPAGNLAAAASSSDGGSGRRSGNSRGGDDSFVL